MTTPTTHYQHVLCSIDLSDESAQILARAAAIAQDNQATFSIAHVLEPLTYAYGGDIPIDLSDVQEELREHAQKRLASMAAAVGIEADRQHILIGQPASELHYLSKEINSDLIVVGSHGREGLALLLGSTSNSVLHGAACDVLAVRITE